MSTDIVELNSPELKAAFQALETYDWGSGRGALMPIDSALLAVASKPGAARQLELRLAQALQTGGPVPKQEYICSKLALIATERSVSVIAELLTKPELVRTACDALEKIPGSAPDKALERALHKTAGLEKAAVLRSLGVRRARGSVKEIGKALHDPDHAVVRQAAEALGRIGTVPAAQLLQRHYGTSVSAAHAAIADALMQCAAALTGDGKSKDAQQIYTLLATNAEPPHIFHAAALHLNPHQSRSH